MKFYKLLIISCLCINYVQGQTYKAAFKADMCACLGEESLKRRLTDRAYKTCFNETLPTYAAQIDAQIVEENATIKYQKGQLARKDLIVALQYELVYSCDVYFKYLDGERTSKKLIARENAKQDELEKYNQMVALTPNAMAYFMRAQLQFNLGNIDEAEADINRSLDINPYKDNQISMRHELLLLAWVYEEQERYTEAVAIYDKIYIGDYDTEVGLLRALADKKSGGTVSKSPSISKDKVENTIKDKSRSRQIRRNESLNKKKTIKTNKSDKSRTLKVEKKKDTSSLRKLLKIGED